MQELCIKSFFGKTGALRSPSETIQLVINLETEEI